MDYREYIEQFGSSRHCTPETECSKCTIANCSDKKRIKELMQLAMEQRKFAIEFYWKRASYFWLFVGAMFVAYTATLPDKDTLDLVQSERINLFVCLVGFFSSVAWYMANRGSKYWQENWELHIEFLSKKLGTPIFEVLMYPRKSATGSPLSYYPYSFTRVNLFLNIIIIIVWAVLSLLGLASLLDISPDDYITYKVLLIGIAGLVVTLCIILLMHINVTSFVKRCADRQNKNFFKKS